MLTHRCYIYLCVLGFCWVSTNALAQADLDDVTIKVIGLDQLPSHHIEVIPLPDPASVEDRKKLQQNHLDRMESLNKPRIPSSNKGLSSTGSEIAPALQPPATTTTAPQR